MNFFIALLALIIVIIIFWVIVSRSINKKRLSQALGLKLLLVTLSQRDSKNQNNNSGPGANWKEEINLSAQLFSILSGLNAPFALETAVHHVGEEIHFYVGVPKESIVSISRQIEGLFEDAQVEPIDDYNIFFQGGEAAGAYLSQKNSYALPLRTYVEANVDTFSPLLSGLSKINEVSEGGAIQILAKPAPKSVKKNIYNIISKLKQGGKTEEILKGNKIEMKDFANAMNPGEEKEKIEKTIDDEAIKAIGSKIAQPLLAVNYRIVTSAPNLMETNSLLDGIGQGITQFGAPLRQELKLNKPRNIKKFLFQYSFREFDDSQSIMINTEELASLFHLPVSTSDIPRIKWLRTKEAAPPQNLPQNGTYMGESNFRGDHKKIYLTDEDRRRHIYVIGQTGTGKSTLMVNMAVENIKQGKGVGVIDPHGDLIEQILENIPKERMDDVIVFDPSDLARPVGMNMLEYDFDRPEQKTFIVNELFNIFDKLYDMKTAGGPMFEQYFKMAVTLLMEDSINEPATLMEIQRVFTDDAFRNKKLGRIANPTVISFWEKEAAKATGEHSLANMSTYITSKINQFTANDFLRPIIGQEKSAFNFRQVMDDGKILLVNLSKGRIGDLNMGLLGMVIIGKILMAAMSRSESSSKDFKDFNLFVDEFQNFTTEATATILSEARKYRLNLTMAHQFIAQLKENIRDAIIGNVGSKIIFRVGSQDAEFLIKEFEPIFSQNDLLNLDNFNACVKILIGGVTAKPFNIRTPKWMSGNRELAIQLKELSRAKYGSARQEVETAILHRLRG